MRKILLTLTLILLAGCKDSAEEITFFPISKECKPRLDQFLKETNQQYGTEDIKVHVQYDYFKLSFPISNPYIGTARIFGEKLNQVSKESIANVSSALCARTESIEVESDFLGIRGMRNYLLSNLDDGETASVQKKGNKIVVSITKSDKRL
jgi:hypothetical protein